MRKTVTDRINKCAKRLKTVLTVTLIYAGLLQMRLCLYRAFRSSEVKDLRINGAIRFWMFCLL